MAWPCAKTKERVNKENKLLVFNSLLLALITLTHIYTTIFAVTSSLFLLIQGGKKIFWKRLRYLATCYAIAFLIVGFWVFPLPTKLEYTTPLNYVWDINDITQFLGDALGIKRGGEYEGGGGEE